MSRSISPNTEVNYLPRHCKLCAKEVCQINRLFALSKRLCNVKKLREGLRKSLERKSHGPLQTNAQISRIIEELTGPVSSETLNTNSVSNKSTMLKVTDLLTRQAIENQGLEVEKLEQRR